MSLSILPPGTTWFCTTELEKKLKRTNQPTRQVPNSSCCTHIPSSPLQSKRYVLRMKYSFTGKLQMMTRCVPVLL